MRRPNGACRDDEACYHQFKKVQCWLYWGFFARRRRTPRICLCPQDHLLWAQVVARSNRPAPPNESKSFICKGWFQSSSAPVAFCGILRFLSAPSSYKIVYNERPSFPGLIRVLPIEAASDSPLI